MTRFDQLQLKKTKKDENPRGGRGGRGGRGRAGRGRGRGRGQGHPEEACDDAPAEEEWDEDWSWKRDQHWGAAEWAAWYESWEEQDDAASNEPKKPKKDKPAPKAKSKSRAPKAKAGSKGKGKVPKSSAKRKVKDEDEAEKPVSKGSRDNEDGPKTFARRYRPQRPILAHRWDCLKAAFQNHVQPHIPSAPGVHEDCAFHAQFEFLHFYIQPANVYAWIPE